MPQASRTFRVFISSTFSDLVEERNNLQEEVFPKLRKLCEDSGYRFQAIDLRWGVSSEASRDQKTIRTCLEEIRRCQDMDLKPNFIVLLGDRYGWRPLPEVIPADEFESLAGEVSGKADRELVDAWYELDENAVPPVYFLRPRLIEPLVDKDVEEAARTVVEELSRYRADAGVVEEAKKAVENGDIEALNNTEKEAWQQTEAKLLEAVREAAARVELNDEQRRKYITSATEQEIEQGVMKVKDADEHVFCFFRNIDPKSFPRGKAEGTFDASAKDFIDIQLKVDAAEGPLDDGAQRMLTDLKGGKDRKGRLEERLGDDNVFRYNATWEGGGNGSPVSSSHIERLCSDVEESLSKVIAAQITGRGAAKVNTVAMEAEAQRLFGEGRADHFTGRTEELTELAEYIDGSDPRPMAVSGDGGCGKSAFMARAFQQAYDDNKDTTFFHSIGATPASSDIRSLLDTLCHQIAEAYGGDETTVPSAYEDLVKDFKERLEAVGNGDRLVIFLDALDQLSDSYNAKSLVWLPGKLPENVRIVVSTRPETLLVALERKLNEQNILQLGGLSRKDGNDLLDKWLGACVPERTIQDFQREEVLKEFMAAEGSPLYLRMAFQEARRWTSGTKGEEIDLGTDIEGIIENLYERLSDSRNHGEVLTSRALGYLAATRNGLSEDEFIDILSEDADPDVLHDFLKRSPDSPQNIKRLPVAVWSRFFLDLEPYLTERISEDVSLLAFYHRELQKVAVKEYLGDDVAKQRHRVLAEYFNSKADPKGQGYRSNNEDERKRWLGSARALSELPYHTSMAEMFDEIFATLTDFEFLENKAARVSISEFAGSDWETKELYGGVFELQKDYELALEKSPSDDTKSSHASAPR